VLHSTQGAMLKLDVTLSHPALTVAAWSQLYHHICITHQEFVAVILNFSSRFLNTVYEKFFVVIGMSFALVYKISRRLVVRTTEVLKRSWI